MDDDEVRHAVFSEKLRPEWQVVHAWTAQEAIDLASSQQPFDAMFLDHDLGDFAQVGTLAPYEARHTLTSMPFVDWLCQNPAKHPQLVVVHSWNTWGARDMANKLKASLGIGAHLMISPFSPQEDYERMIIDHCWPKNEGWDG